MRMVVGKCLRATLVCAVLIGAAGGCEPARIVDCAPGVFVRVEGEAWCIYDRLAMVRCPDLLPVEHELSWGDRGCAEREHSPPPIGLCAAVGECQDAGSDG